MKKFQLSFLLGSIIVGLGMGVLTTLAAEANFTFASGNSTSDRMVELRISYPTDTKKIVVTNKETNGRKETFGPISSVQWLLSTGTGKKTVVMEFQDEKGKKTQVEKSITYTEPNTSLKEGTLIKDPSGTVYFFGFDKKLHAFLSLPIYLSWFNDFSQVKVASRTVVRNIERGTPMCIRPGTWLVKFRSFGRVYAVEPGCQLRPLRSEVEATVFYGKDWAKRVRELDSSEMVSYQVMDPSALSASDDRDQDGVEDTKESEFHTSDKRIDSDSDLLSDYEEIFVWFTDPRRQDTDGDGVKDGKEIMSGNSPVGEGKITTLPQQYTYPVGSLIYDAKNKQYVYQHWDGHTYFLSKTMKDKAFTSNNFSDRFVSRSTFPWKIQTRSGYKLLSNDIYLMYPLVRVGNGYQLR